LQLAFSCLWCHLQPKLPVSGEYPKLHRQPGVLHPSVLSLLSVFKRFYTCRRRGQHQDFSIRMAECSICCVFNCYILFLISEVLWATVEILP